jgi:sterol desaturase/sphingolipid hydroxylase (fatty acid hydroxylase superfamily)
MNQIVPLVCKAGGSGLIKVRGKHLDKLESIDNTYIFINKCLTVIFTYHVIWLCYITPSIKWKIEEITLANTIGSLICFYIFYDFFYMWFHRILHIRALYPWIHKHHHRQKAPSRGNTDAINVHPFEFLVGEYLHLLTIYIIPCHIITVACFIMFGGIFASLNHTRFDIQIPGVYSVNVHDVHHRLPESNYAQYIMLWDYLFGSYRPYASALNAKDD